MVVSVQNFFPIVFKILLFSKKFVNDKIFETSFSIKKFIFILVARGFLSFKRYLGPRITNFWKKLVNNKIFDTSFVIKSYVNFRCKTPSFPKKLSNEPPKHFFTVFSENTAFFEKIVKQKNILHRISNKKRYIHFWCKMTPNRSHCDTVGRVANKVRIEGGEPYFYGPKYRSSDAIPAPEIFFLGIERSNYRRTIARLI